MDDEYTIQKLDLSDPNEFIVNIQAINSYFIMYLEIKTNLGTVFKVGSSKISDAALKAEFNAPAKEIVPSRKNKEISLHKGARVHCITGCYEKYLQSL